MKWNPKRVGGELHAFCAIAVITQPYPDWRSGGEQQIKKYKYEEKEQMLLQHLTKFGG